MLAAAIAGCTARLAAADLAHPGREALLREAAQVPDDYLGWQRVVGLYWLTRIPFAHSIRSWQESVREVFARPVAALPVAGRLERYWFWPMGVPEPGAMRQWGRHATAFVGRRHFDDADLSEKYFEMKLP